MLLLGKQDRKNQSKGKENKGIRKTTENMKKKKKKLNYYLITKHSTGYLNRGRTLLVEIALALYGGMTVLQKYLRTAEMSTDHPQ